MSRNKWIVIVRERVAWSAAPHRSRHGKRGTNRNPVKCMGNSKRSNQDTALERESVWRHRALEIDGEGALLRQQEWCRESFDGSLMDEEVCLLVIRQLGSEEMVGGGVGVPLAHPPR